MGHTSMCTLCNGIAWTGSGEDVSEIMEKHRRSEWCTCDHFFDEEDTSYPPEAGTGFLSDKTYETKKFSEEHNGSDSEGIHVLPLNEIVEPIQKPAGVTLPQSIKLEKASIA